jgi:hypothetical protein
LWLIASVVPEFIAGNSVCKTQLTQEQWQSLTVAARVLENWLEEVFRNVTQFLEKFADVKPSA